MDLEPVKEVKGIVTIQQLREALSDLNEDMRICDRFGESLELCIYGKSMVHDEFAVIY